MPALRHELANERLDYRLRLHADPLDQAVTAAQSFRPMNPDESEALLAKTAQAAQLGKYEHYKTTHTFDGTFQHPQWLG